MMIDRLSPEQIRLLAPFVREYEQAREYTASVRQQAEDAVRRAEESEQRAGERMLRAGALACGGRTDLQVDYDTYEVAETAAEDRSDKSTPIIPHHAREAAS